MNDFVEIQYSVLWKLCFDHSYFWLVETIIGIREILFPKKELILAIGQLIFHLVETIFFSPFFGDPRQFFFVWWKSIFHKNPYFWLVKMEFRANNGFHKQKKKL